MKLKQLHEEERRKRNMRDVLGHVTLDDDICAHYEKLESLLYSPEKVVGDFQCEFNKLTSLEHGPSVVGGYFNCGSNMLTSLEFGPTEVGGDYNCEGNELTSLVGAPKIIHSDFYCSANKLTSLDGVPAVITDALFCYNNKLTSLKGIHKQIREMTHFYAARNPELKHHLLGLILIDNLTKIHIDNKDIEKILNKYLGQPNKKVAMLQCQQELIEAGFEDAAQL